MGLPLIHDFSEGSMTLLGVTTYYFVPGLMIPRVPLSHALISPCFTIDIWDRPRGAEFGSISCAKDQSGIGI
jgi:hypothetical protein